MTEDVLERLQRANPVPDDVPAPPIEVVLARLQSEPPRLPRRSPWSRWGGAVAPVAGIAIVIAVVVVVLAGHPSRPTTPGVRPSAVHGLRGVVFAGGRFGAGGRGVVAVDQCYPCRAAPHGGRQVDRTWTLSTSDGGASWHTQRTRFGLGLAFFNSGVAQFSGPRDVWAIGSYRVGEGPIRFDAYVSHDGGRGWAMAATPEHWVLGDLSVASGTVWATSGGTCVGRFCAGAEVLRGSAAGNVLTAAALGPWAASSALRIAAASASTAYIQVIAGHQPVRTLVTRDGGNNWKQLPTVCHISAPDGILRAAGPDSVWQVCPMPGPTTVMARSEDGGRHWHRYRIPTRSGLGDLIPVSSRAAWGISDSGDVIVTADGGASWRLAWSTAGYLPRAHISSVSPQSATVATLTATQVSGGRTRVVIYRTQDGGRTWHASYVPLPNG